MVLFISITSCVESSSLCCLAIATHAHRDSCKRGERWQILKQCGRKPTPKWGFCAMAAAVVIRFRYACGYEYTGVLRTYRRKIPARRSPTQDISPKKLSKTYPGGQKKPGKKPVFLLSWNPVNPVISGLYYLMYWRYMENRPKHQHPGGASGYGGKGVAKNG